MTISNIYIVSGNWSKTWRSNLMLSFISGPGILLDNSTKLKPGSLNSAQKGIIRVHQIEAELEFTMDRFWLSKMAQQIRGFPPKLANPS